MSRLRLFSRGAVDTNIAQNSGVEIKMQDEERAQNFSPLSPETAAETIIDGMARNKFQVYLGKDSSIMNILYRINPRWATHYMFKQMKTLLPD